MVTNPRMRKKDIEEFRRIAELLVIDGNLDALIALVPDKRKIEVINNWNQRKQARL